MPITQLPAIALLEVDPVERWNIHKRLQELSVGSQCGYGQPLQVELTTATAAIQAWSVVQQFTAPREVRQARLRACWNQGVFR